MGMNPVLSLNSRQVTITKFVVVAGVLLYLPVALADINDVMSEFKTAGQVINGQLIKPAIKTAVAALTLQWILTFWKEIFSADLSSAIPKTVGIIGWFGFSILLINNVDILGTLFAGYVKLAGGLAGLSGTEFSPAAIIEIGKKIITQVHEAVGATAGEGITALAKNVAAALGLIVVDVILLLCFFMIGLSLFVAHLEFWMLFAVAPLALALIPLSAVRDQGLAPLKGVLALGLRIIILGVVVSVLKAIAASAAVNIPKAVQSTADGFPLIAALYDYLAGILGCAVMAFYSGKLAATIVSGQASFSGSDAVKAGMQIVATGGMVGGAAAVAGAAAKAAPAAAMNAARGAIEGGKGAASRVSQFAEQAASRFSSSGGAGSNAVGGGLGGSLDAERPSPAGSSQAASSFGNSSPGSAGSGGNSPVGDSQAASSSGSSSPGSARSGGNSLVGDSQAANSSGSSSPGSGKSGGNSPVGDSQAASSSGSSSPGFGKSGGNSPGGDSHAASSSEGDRSGAKLRDSLDDGRPSPLAGISGTEQPGKGRLGSRLDLERALPKDDHQPVAVKIDLKGD